MNLPWKQALKTSFVVTGAFVLVLGGLPVSAEDSVDTLQNKTSTLQQELSGLHGELDATSAELSNIVERTKTITETVQRTKEELAAAQQEEEKQYNSMKKRIRYLYEGGTTSFWDVLFSSVSMADFLNKADFIKNVNVYDRHMLTRYSALCKEIKVKQENLQKEEQMLTDSKTAMEQKKEELRQKISTTSGELSSYQQQLQKAQEAREAAEAALKAQLQQIAKEQSNKEAEASKQPTNQPNAKPVTSPPAEVKPASPDTPKPAAPSSGNGSSSAYEGSSSETKVFATILEAEAGSRNKEGLLAVATVIMNRVESSAYPNTISGVVFQSGQFSPTWNGSYNRIYKRGPSSLAYQVATEAMNGARLNIVKNCYQFRGHGTMHVGIVVGGNTFF